MTRHLARVTWNGFLSVQSGMCCTSRSEVTTRDHTLWRMVPVCAHTGRRQLGSIVGKSWIMEEAALAMPIPLDLCSTEDHGDHLPE